MGRLSLEYPALDAVLTSRNARGGVEDYLVTLTGGSSCNYALLYAPVPFAQLSKWYSPSPSPSFLMPTMILGLLPVVYTAK